MVLTYRYKGRSKKNKIEQFTDVNGRSAFIIGSGKNRMIEVIEEKGIKVKRS